MSDSRATAEAELAKALAKRVEVRNSSTRVLLGYIPGSETGNTLFCLLEQGSVKWDNGYDPAPFFNLQDRHGVLLPYLVPIENLPPTVFLAPVRYETGSKFECIRKALSNQLDLFDLSPKLLGHPRDGELVTERCDPEILRMLVQLSADNLRKVPRHMIDEKLVFAAVTSFGYVLVNAPRVFKTIRYIVLAAIKQDSRAYNVCYLKNDPEVRAAYEASRATEDPPQPSPAMIELRKIVGRYDARAAARDAGK